MKREAVISRAIRSVGYQTDTLELEFVDGDVYRYILVPPSVFLELMQAESKGAFFNDRIRDAIRPTARSELRCRQRLQQVVGVAL